MPSPPPRNHAKVGLSRRELEWAAQEMVRDLPGDQQKMAKAFADMVVSLINKNNAALASLVPAGGAHDDEGQR